MPKTVHSARQRRLIEVLVASREKAGLTQSQVAKALKRHQPFVSGIESGHRRIDLIELMDIADILGADIHDIIRELHRLPGLKPARK
ncbi:MAG TPA: helix-turn-helix transcriptional regulator [Pseudolabrys sp.]|jgi:HTH-type transcriptional regulator/antitoxin HipB|nr:helix-turn-helix transcriptional regulator [Pseudolabrys sp.]